MYIYNADTYCDSCGRDIMRGIHRTHRPTQVQYTDSDHYPQSATEESTDGPNHCGSAGECLEGIDLGDYGLAQDAPLYGAESRTIGALLSDSLTEYGVTYLREMLDDSHDLTPYQVALHKFWREAFADQL